MIVEDGRIWLPNLECVQERILEFYDTLSEYFDIWVETDEMLNPLYNATEDPAVEKELLRCPDVLINQTQMATLYDFSDDPFYVLQIKKEYAGVASTPQPIVAAVVTATTSKRTSPIKTSACQASDSDTTTSSDNDITSQCASISEESAMDGSQGGSGKRTKSISTEGGSAKRSRQ